jgi:hypothetical protein
MVASSVQLNAGKVGLCDLTPHRSFTTTMALRPGCLQVQPLLQTRWWNKTVDEPHVGQRGPVSVSPFRVRTDTAELLRQRDRSSLPLGFAPW